MPGYGFRRGRCRVGGGRRRRFCFGVRDEMELESSAVSGGGGRIRKWVLKLGFCGLRVISSRVGF